MKRFSKQSTGFTIVELMIATAVFSVILLLCATAIVQVGRMFYKGTVVNKTQDSARAVTDDVVQAIQFGTISNSFRQVGSATYNHGGGNVAVSSLCLGTVRYTYNTDRSLGSNATSQSLHILWKDHIAADSACSALDITQANPPGSSADGQELLGDNMRIPVFTIPDHNIANIWNISLVVSYGDSDVFNAASNYTQCLSSSLGGQFCAVSTINTNVVKRL